MSAPGVDDRDVRLKRLHKACEVTLERYFAIASDSCKMTAMLRALPVSKDKRLELFLQKKKEDGAREAYLKARGALLSAIEADPDLVYTEHRHSRPSNATGTPRVHRGKVS